MIRNISREWRRQDRRPLSQSLNFCGGFFSTSHARSPPHRKMPLWFTRTFPALAPTLKAPSKAMTLWIVVFNRYHGPSVRQYLSETGPFLHIAALGCSCPRQGAHVAIIAKAFFQSSRRPTFLWTLSHFFLSLSLQLQNIILANPECLTCRSGAGNF